MFHIIRLRERRLALISFSLSLSRSPMEMFQIYLDHLKLFPFLWKYFLREKSLLSFYVSSRWTRKTKLLRGNHFFQWLVNTFLLLFGSLQRWNCFRENFHFIWFSNFFLWQMYKSQSLWDNIDKIFDFIAAVWNKHRLFFEYPIFGFEITGRVKLWKISNVSLLFSVQR